MAGVIAGLMVLVFVLIRAEKVQFCRDGMILLKNRGLKSVDWALIPWADIVKIDLRKDVTLLYAGSAFHRTHISFIRNTRKETLSAVADQLLLHQHKGEIPKVIQIIGP